MRGWNISQIEEGHCRGTVTGCGVLLHVSPAATACPELNMESTR